jgi:hypothetical protein
MSQKIKSIILSALTLLTFGAPMVLAPVVASAACTDAITKGLGSGIDTATNGDGGGSTCNSGSTGGVKEGISRIAKQVVDIFSIIIGIIAVIMIIFGGFKYITSGGDSGNVSGAKNTLIYAIIGLIIVALAQLIVRYVLNTANSVGTGA